MTRVLYRWLMWMHPAAFRERFAPELVGIFDEEHSKGASWWLLADGVASLGRQWLLRQPWWVLLMAAGAAMMELMFVRAMWHLPTEAVHAMHPAHSSAMQSGRLMFVVLLTAVVIVVMVGVAAWRSTAMMIVADRRHGR